MQICLQPFVRIGHDEPILRAGHGHIQHPHFLGNTFRRGFCHDRTLGNCRIPNSVGFIRNRQTQTQLLVAQHLCPEAVPIELPGKAAQEHHREFQTLGFVNAHDGDTAAGLAGGLKPLLLQGIQMLQKLAQSPPGGGFKVRCQLIEGLQIGRSSFAAGHGGKNAVHTGQCENPLHQLGDGVHSGLLPQQLQCLQKSRRPGRVILPQSVKEAALFPIAPAGCQLVRRKSENGTCQHRD